MKKSLLFVTCAAAMTLSACVTAGTHEKLQLELAQSREEFDQALQDCQRLVGQCNAELDQVRAEVEQQESERAQLETRLAQVLKDKDALDASVEDMSLAMAELNRSQQEADKRIAEFRALLKRFGDLIDAGKLKVKIIDGRMIVEMATDVLFSSGSAKLSKEGEEAVIEVTGILASIPTRKFQIEGHTDNVPIKSAKFPSNWHLAAARALSVVDTMLEAGMPAQRVSAASFGETRPSTQNETREGRQVNRRIEIVILPDLSLLPGFDELQQMGN
jgi:chemotaxis protein MotB